MNKSDIMTIELESGDIQMVTAFVPILIQWSRIVEFNRETEKHAESMQDEVPKNTSGYKAGLCKKRKI